MRQIKRGWVKPFLNGEHTCNLILHNKQSCTLNHNPLCPPLHLAPCLFEAIPSTIYYLGYEHACNECIYESVCPPRVSTYITFPKFIYLIIIYVYTCVLLTHFYVYFNVIFVLMYHEMGLSE